MQTSRKKIGLVVPCYNEERRLRKEVFIEELRKNPELTVLFVNDGSKDNTLEVVKNICALNPHRALFLSLNENKGKGEAVRQGMLHLLSNGDYNLIGFWDADLAVPLSEIKSFVDPLQNGSGFRGVIGGRVHLAGRVIERVHFRHYLGRIFATLMCLTFKLKIYDTQCGAKIFAREILDPVLGEKFCSRWIFDVEMIIRISRLSILRGKEWLYEIPVNEWRNISETKRTASAYLIAVLDYLTLVRKYLR